MCAHDCASRARSQSVCVCAHTQGPPLSGVSVLFIFFLMYFRIIIGLPTSVSFSLSLAVWLSFSVSLCLSLPPTLSLSLCEIVLWLFALVSPLSLSSSLSSVYLCVSLSSKFIALFCLCLCLPLSLCCLSFHLSLLFLLFHLSLLSLSLSLSMFASFPLSLFLSLSLPLCEIVLPRLSAVSHFIPLFGHSLCLFVL